jgi:hypothetical protein
MCVLPIGTIVPVKCLLPLEAMLSSGYQAPRRATATSARQAGRGVVGIGRIGWRRPLRMTHSADAEDFVLAQWRDALVAARV